MDMNSPKAKILASLLFCLPVLPGGANLLHAQDYPKRPIHLVLDKSPGDVTDISGRAVGEQLSKILKVPVVAINKPGAGGVEGTDFVAKASKDGYTLLFASSAPIVAIPVIQAKTVPYHPIRDLEPLGKAVSSPMVIAVKSDSQWKSLKGLIDYANANPEKLRLGHTGRGTVTDLNIAIIGKAAGVKITAVPFKGGAPAIAATLGGHVDGNSLTLAPNLPHIRAGKIRALVISDKSSQASQVPTAAEAGFPNIKLLGAWVGAFAPAGTPESVMNVLVPAFEKAINSPEVVKTIEAVGVSLAYLNPAEFKKSIKEQIEVVHDIAEKVGLIKN